MLYAYLELGGKGKSVGLGMEIRKHEVSLGNYEQIWIIGDVFVYPETIETSTDSLRRGEVADAKAEVWAAERVTALRG